MSRQRPGRSPARAGAGAAWCAALLVAGAVLAQDRARPQPGEGVEPSPALLELLEAPYLSEQERRDLRVRHGLWKEGDLDSPALAARAALVRGAYDDPSLSDAGAPAEDRAEAMLRRGQAHEMLALLDGRPGLRAARLRAEALLDLGRHDGAAEQLAAVVKAMSAAPAESAQELVEGVRGLMLLTRLPETALAQDRNTAGEFRTLMGLLARARERLDRFSYEARLAEAQLLYEKDNTQESVAAIQEALALNPRCAAAWALFGQIACDQFDFDRATKVAARLDEIGGGTSAEGSLLLARVRLRQNDAEAAEKTLAPISERFPRMRDLLALKAAAAAGRFDEARTAGRLKEFDSAWPGSPVALLEVGRVLSGRRQYEQGAERLKQAAQRSPGWPEPLVELGLLYVQAGRDEDARPVLEQGAALDPFNARVANSLKLVRELAGYTRFESEHFVVRCRPGVDEVLGSEMLVPLEAMYRRVTGKGRGGIDFEPPGRTIIDLMPDHAWFSVRITGIPQVHTIAASTGPLVAMEAPRSGAGSSLGPYDWARVLQHEYTHTVTLARTRNRLPHWFTEAAAVYLEDAPRSYDRCQLLTRAVTQEELFDFDEINIAFVRPRKPSDRSLAYAQGHWMYEFMLERYGERAPLDLMDKYAAGMSEAEAMPAVLGCSREEFLGEFEVWAREQLVRWGMKTPEGVPSVRELLVAEARSQGTDETKKPDEEEEPELPEPTQEMVDRWLERYPAHPQVLNLAVSMAIEHTGGKPEPSMALLLERYAAARPVDPLPRKLLARLYLDSPEPAKALPHLEYLDEREQNSITFAMDLARRYSAAGNWEKAGEKAERATRISPFDPSARELAATVALQRKDFETAGRHLAALTRLEPDRAVHRQRLEALEKLRGTAR